MKKQYIKPAMKVYPLNGTPQILAGSGYPDDWNGPVGYAPGLADKEMNHLA